MHLGTFPFTMARQCKVLAQQPSSQRLFVRLESSCTGYQPASQLASQPASQPASQLASKLARQVASQPASWPARPASHPASWPASWPARWPASQLASQPASQPASQLASKLARQVASQLASQPASQPSSWPASWPAMWPASQLACIWKPRSLRWKPTCVFWTALSLPHNPALPLRHRGFSTFFKKSLLWSAVPDGGCPPFARLSCGLLFGVTRLALAKHLRPSLLTTMPPS